jgi:hypothetical protein
LIVVRMQAAAGTDLVRMPPLATSVLDQSGINIISQWIKGIKTSP